MATLTPWGHQRAALWALYLVSPVLNKDAHFGRQAIYVRRPLSIRP